MTSVIKITGRVLAVMAMMAASPAVAQEDPGNAKIGQVRVSVYFATNGEPSAGNAKMTTVSEEVLKRLRGEEKLRFNEYRLLGQDTKPLTRSYDSWAQPLKPSEELWVRFEARTEPTKEVTGLDLELWISRKKILKTDAWLKGDRPLFVLGPEWRGGRLIIGVALAPKEKPGS